MSQATIKKLLLAFCQISTTPDLIPRKDILAAVSGQYDLTQVIEFMKQLVGTTIKDQVPMVYRKDLFVATLNEMDFSDGVENIQSEMKYHEADGRNDPNSTPIIKTASYRLLEELISPLHPLNIYISGETGLGKSSSVFEIAKKFNKPVIRVNMSGATDIDDLLGGIRIVDGSTVFDPGPVALAMEQGAILLLDECLSEDEAVRIGTVENWSPIKLKDLHNDAVYQVVSYNETTRLLENDFGYIISDRIDELYEIELEDGRKIIANAAHPFFDCAGTQITIKSNTLLVGADLLVV